MRRFLVCFVIAMVVCAASFGASFAEDEAGGWYLYGLEKTDSYAEAAEKIADAFSDQDVSRNDKHVQVALQNYYMFDLGVDEISITDKGDHWLLFIMTAIVRSDEDYQNMYKLYSGLVEKLGAPVECSPVVKKATFDGVTETSIFESEDDFVSAMKSSEDEDCFTAKFGNCELEINAYGYGYVSAFLRFDNKKADMDGSITVFTRK